MPLLVAVRSRLRFDFSLFLFSFFVVAGAVSSLLCPLCPHCGPALFGLAFLLLSLALSTPVVGVGSLVVWEFDVLPLRCGSE